MLLKMAAFPSGTDDLEEHLFNVFTYYTTRGNSQDPQHLRMETFFKMCQECGIVDHVHVLKEDCYVVYRAVVSKRADLHTGRGTSLGSHGKLTISEQAKSLMVRSDPGVKHAAVKKMQFSDWLSALSELAKKRFGESNDEVDDINSFERLIMDNLVPATKFRSAVPVALDEVRHLYKDFGPAFRDVIQYYGEFVGSEEKEDEAKRGGSRLDERRSSRRSIV